MPIDVCLPLHWTFHFLSIIFMLWLCFGFHAFLEQEFLVMFSIVSRGQKCETRYRVKGKARTNSRLKTLPQDSYRDYNDSTSFT